MIIRRNRQYMDVGRRRVLPLVWLSVLMLAGVMGGCTLIQRVAVIPAEAVRSLFFAVEAKQVVDPVALQDDLLEFADTFITTTTLAVERLTRPDGTIIGRFDQVRLKNRLMTDMLSLVSGSNQLANLVQTMVYVTSVRISIEDYWLPSANGISELPLLTVLREREAGLNELARGVLTPEQRAQLKVAIDDWRKNRKLTEFDLGTFASFSLVNDVIAHTQSKTAESSSSIFALLDLDPLAGLDPATRELTETRLFGERALFLGKRMPLLLEFQAELLVMRTSDTPEIRQVVANASQIALAADRIGQTFSVLPGLIDSERNKLIGDFRGERQGLMDLSRQLEKMMGESTRTADSAGRALITFSQVLDQLNQTPKNPDSRPFDIRDYTEAAEKVEAMSLRITTLLRELQLDLDRVDAEKISQLTQAVTQETEKRTVAVVDHVYHRGLWFVFFASLILSLCLLLAGLAYKYISHRMAGA